MLEGEREPAAGVPRDLTECLKEIRALKRDVYGDPQIRQKGVFDRLEKLEERLGDFRVTYEREKVEKEHFESVEAKLDELGVNYRLVLIYLRGIAVGSGAILITVVGAVVVGLIRFFAGGA